METADVTTCPSWKAYFQNLAEDQPATVDYMGLKSRVQQRGKDLFTTEDDLLNVRITDISQNGLDVYSKEYLSVSDISGDTDLDFHNDARVRIISICSETSLGPLLIPADFMGKIMQRHKVDPSFLQVLLSFNEAISTSTTGARNAMICSANELDTYISYQMFYVEAKHLDRPKPTISFRRTGIYHHRTANRDLFIILHPNESSKFDTRLQKFIEIDNSTNPQMSIDVARLASFIANPAIIHSILFSSFTDNWRWYICNLGEEFKRINDYALTRSRPGITMDPNQSLDEITELRSVADFVHLARICCKGNLDIIRRLQTKTAGPTNTYDIFEATISGCIASCKGLIPRIQNATDMVGYILSARNQLQAAETQRRAAEIQTQAAGTGRELRDLTANLKDLQKHTVDDSSSIKIITVMSAVYLPGTFVVSLYGMNFFDFDEAKREIVITKDFWIFVATWVPLTVLTMGAYVLIVYFDKWWKHEPFRFFSRPRSKRFQ